MPISPLPESDARQLGATLAITTPVVLVKELLDNALDSGATAVALFVSSNTVDRVELRDNGHGIHPSDFEALGRSGCTSKLTSLDELRTVGTHSLGFRGVALASIKTLATVTVTTRTSGEAFAEVLRLMDGGGIRREGRKGNPVGTSVCVAELFAKIPVRRRSAIKEAPKTISSIKDLLQSYAFARHQTKIVFRVLEKPESTWCYIPKVGSSVREPASQLFGPDIASHCRLEAYSSRDNEAEERYQRNRTNPPISFEGLFPLAGVNPKKLLGAFFSVDSRPLSSSRGIGKKLLSIFRTHYSQSAPLVRLNRAAKPIFIQLNIVCPPGSYDVNVEPTKNDVLFADEELLIGHFKRFLSSIYCRNEDEAYSNRRGGIESPPPSSSAARKSNVSELRRGWTVDMSGAVDTISDDGGGDDGDKQHSALCELDEDGQPQPSDGDNAEPPLEALNPWSIAMLAAPRHPQVSHTPKAIPQRHRDRSVSPATSVDISESPLDLGRRAYTTRGPRHRQRHFSTEQSPDRPARGVPGGPYRRPMPVTGDTADQRRRAAGFRGPDPSQQAWVGGRSIPSRAMSQQHRPGPSELIQTTLSFGNQESSQRQRETEYQRSDQLGNSSPPLAGAPMIEHCHDEMRVGLTGLNNEKVNEKHARPPSRKELPLRAIPGNPRHRTSPAGGLREVRDAPVDVPMEEPLRRCLPAEDRRAHLIKRQRSIAQAPEKRFRRLRTDLLPLEVTPCGFETRSLALTLKIDTCLLSAKLSARETQVDVGLGTGDLKSFLEAGHVALLERQISTFLSNIGIAASTLEFKSPGSPWE